jgi:hypothetical protein
VAFGYPGYKKRFRLKIRLKIMDNNSSKFGDTLPFSEPTWYDSTKRSPYYNEHHVKYRATMRYVCTCHFFLRAFAIILTTFVPFYFICREFVDNEIIPNVEEWEEAGEVPRSAFKRASEVGMLPAMCGWPTDVSLKVFVSQQCST